MAIYGAREDCAAQVGLGEQHPGFQLAFRFLQEVTDGTHEAARVLADLPEGKVQRFEIDGDRVYAMLMHRPTISRDQGQMEAHRQYADVQFVLRGREVMEVAPLAGLTAKTEYNVEKDAQLFHLPEDGAGTKLLMDDQSCAVLFPSDAHSPMQARDGDPRLSRRVVVKVLDPFAG